MRKNKYNVSPKAKRMAFGILFDSKKEMERYLVLRSMEDAGEIHDLDIQPGFVLQPAFTDLNHRSHREIKYFADFEYTEPGNERKVIEEVKGKATREFMIKKKLFLYKYDNEYDYRIIK